MVFCICGKIDKRDADHSPGNVKVGESVTSPMLSTDVSARENTIPLVRTPTKATSLSESKVDVTTITATPAESDSLHSTPVPSRHMPSPRKLSHSPLCQDDNLESDSPCWSVPNDQALALISCEPFYIDEYGSRPEDQYNTASSVSFFNVCSSTMGYPTARLLQFRLHGILSIPESSHRPELSSQDL